MDLLVGDGHGGVAAEGRTPDHELVEHAAQGVDVGAGVDGVAPGLLGGEVGGGAHHRADLGEVVVGGGGDGPGDAEVGHLHEAVLVDEDVARLHVAVDHAVAVGEAQGGGHVGADVGGPVGVERPVGAEDLGEGPAVTYSMTMK